MLNPSGLDPTTARGFAQYGQQGSTAFPLVGNLGGALQGGGVQAGLQGVRGGITGLQAASATPQQAAQGRFAAGTLQSNLQQLTGQYQARGGPLGNAGLANGVLAGAAAAGVRAGALGGLNMQPGLIARDPSRTATINLANLGAGNPAGLGMQGYASAQNSLAAALGTQQLNNLGINRLGISGLQAGLQAGRVGLNQNTPGLNLLQQGMATSAAINPSQDLLAIIGKQRQVPGGAAAGFNAAQLNLGNFGNNAQQPLGTVGPSGLQDGEGSTFDNSEFPTLGGAGRQQQQQSNTSALGLGGGDPYANLGLRKAAAAVAGGNASEFSMQSEDFPALPGSSQRDGFPGGQARQGFPLLPGGEQLLQQQGLAGSDYELQLRLQQARAATLKSGPGQLDAAGGKGAPAPDKYGLLGLMPLLKMSDQDLTMLALGTDLTSLGLNLNSAENLHKTFVSCLADNPIKPEPEFELPACYKHTPQRLQPGYLQKFKEETLFYVFYSMPQDEAQLIAADELNVRGWWFHKRYKLWMIHAPNTQVQKSPRGERGAYLVFDPHTWEIVPKSDVEILYDDIEQPPRLPRPKHLQAPARH